MFTGLTNWLEVRFAWTLRRRKIFEWGIVGLFVLLLVADSIVGWVIIQPAIQHTGTIPSLPFVVAGVAWLVLIFIIGETIYDATHSY